MKHTYLLFLFFLFCHSIVGQATLIDTVRSKIESIIEELKTETDNVAKIELLVSIHRNRIQGFPTLYIEAGQKLNKLSQDLKDPILEANSWSLFGQGYRLLGNYVKGLECHHKAIVLAEKAGNKVILAIAQNEMGHIYKDRDENEKAQRLYMASAENAKLGIETDVLGWPTMNLGAIFLAMRQPDSSLYYSQLALKLFGNKEIPTNDPYIIMNIAGAYSQKGDQATAIANYYKALTGAQKLGINRYYNMVCVSLAEHYLRNNQPDSCAYYAKKAIASVQQTEFTFLSIKPAKLLTDLYEESNADSTLKYLRIFRAANDSLFNARNTQQLQILTFEEEQRQQELATQKAAYQYKIKTNILLGGLGTILLVALILFRNNKQKQKANALLHRQKEEIQKTLSSLKATQMQLVQAEKMASLGELTAGIAHEIKNPLNFVNNFSEVNAELIDELQEELLQGNVEAAKQVAANIKENETKIQAHGKRADAIVKGMLQHSRNSSGQKEPVDLNALCDEYVRLAYHGLRARDKTFNATIRTEFDSTIGLIQLVPQDIGRVLLNLITNAFYAVNEKKKMNSASSPSNGEYMPTVILRTKFIHHVSQGVKNGSGRWIEISIADNGPGIPKAVMDKIFQPFFTTKPTGEGTGLGLSLSYDIVKAHDGELRAETSEDGATFTITLPVE